MEAKIVLGLGFGDEGKGLTTDFLCQQNDSNKIVVRFSGGQQAGHNVQIGDVNHIHASFGSGTLRGVPSYFSEHCTVYPPNLLREYEVLQSKGITPELYLHPLAMITTPFDVAFNKCREKKFNHGSCGMGIGATMSRNKDTGYKLYAIDLSNPKLLWMKIQQIELYYLSKANEIGTAEDFHKYWTEEIRDFRNALLQLQFNVKSYEFLKKYSEVIFEGSQGILLDMDHGIFPHVTYANTTCKNAIQICKEIGADRIDTYYVTRCYQTRHGNGWMSNNDVLNLINNEKEINITNDWQGEFRVGELDYELLNYALDIDKIYAKNQIWNVNLIVTCLDQRPDFQFNLNKLKHRFNKIFYSHSPDSAYVTNNVSSLVEG